MQFFRPVWFIIITSLVLSNCQTDQQTKPIKPFQDRPLNKNIIERNALVDNWKSVKNHLREVDFHSLNRIDKIYGLYWLGAAEYYLGDRIKAKQYWHRALSLKPSRSMKDQLKQALIATGESFDNHSMKQYKNKWAIQLGLFSTKSSAEKLAKKLTWKNYQVHIQNIYFNQKNVWAVWIGPYSKSEAQSIQQSLNKSGFTSILKKAETLL